MIFSRFSYDLVNLSPPVAIKSSYLIECDQSPVIPEQKTPVCSLVDCIVNRCIEMLTVLFSYFKN